MSNRTVDEANVMTVLKYEQEPFRPQASGCAAEEDICSGCNECGRDEVEALEKSGHTNHCAARMVWGDGECECKRRVP
jgi:hypothetical protein